MKKINITKPGVLLLFMVTLLLMLPMYAVANTNLEDGEYSIGYTVLHSDNDSASIANDYWVKPAKIVVNNGNMVAQMTLNNSSWITEFKVHNQDVQVLSTDQANDKRVVQFPIDSFSTLSAQIHVIVEDIDYDHGYTVRFSFDESSLKTIQLAEGGEQEQSSSNNSQSAGTTTNSSNNNQVENPQTNDSTMPIVFITLFILSAFYLVKQWKSREA
ncbi:heme uptake protein IsdC [Alkalihalobacillus trypoxylicola]|nr:heme uptake protein IsdC [Alkalihalobacillus trypoxylicola]